MKMMTMMTDIGTIVVLGNSHEYEEIDEEEGNEVGDEDNEIMKQMSKVKMTVKTRARANIECNNK